MLSIERVDADATVRASAGLLVLSLKLRYPYLVLSGSSVMFLTRSEYGELIYDMSQSRD